MKFLNERVWLAPHWHVEALPDEEAILLISEEEGRILDKPLVRAILPLLNGDFRGADIVKQLAADFPTFEVVQALIDLNNNHIITTGERQLPAEQAAFWSANAVEVNGSQTGTVGVHVIGDGRSEIRHEALLEGLRLLDLTIAAEGETADLHIVLTRDYLDPALAEMADQMTGPWLLVKPDGRLIWLGPLIVPGETACWHCLTHRLGSNREAHQLFRQEHGSNERVPLAVLPTGQMAALQLAATQIGRWFVAPDAHPLRNRLLTFNSATLEAETHVVVRRPQCPACGSGGLPEPGPIVLEHRPASGNNESGHRELSAEAMLERFQHHISPLTGLVSGLRPVGEGVARIYSAPHLKGGPAVSWGMLQHHRRNNAGGKGVSDAQAKASALGEALERYASMWDGSEYQIAASYEELGEQAVFPNDVMLFSEKQFAVRQDRTYAEQAYKRAAALPLPADMTIKWVKSWSLTRERPVYQALAHAYFDYPHQPDNLYCIGDSNGNAAGTSLEDAVLQGFLELVERESVALWWYNRLQRPGIDLAGVNDAYIEALKAHYVGLQREFWVLDLTADFGIPACVALSRRTDGGPDEVVPGFGAHLDPRIAVTRALTEMNQLMPSALAQAERIDRRLPEEGDPLTLNDLRAVEHPYLLPDPNQPLRRVGDFNMPDFKDLYEEVSWCRAQVEAKGLEMLVLDLTRPDVGLPVVKVTVPGMRHFWRRLAPGRLYDVPVQMGWLAEPLEEEDINEVDLTG